MEGKDGSMSRCPGGRSALAAKHGCRPTRCRESIRLLNPACAAEPVARGPEGTTYIFEQETQADGRQQRAGSCRQNLPMKNRNPSGTFTAFLCILFWTIPPTRPAPRYAT
ncbi:hypothetical protein EYF80_028303 [Liparis tanakae]|uniref:Uncharacterized protein n=1 Tax=Liparis tanakae TaxID=230148 RepID=A0A4Z2H983_9TELE|nr:hypothetical protein EYF80_028303 [Liparis tanakae]